MKTPISYLQTDSRWKSIDYSATGESTTIGASGCGPTCMAMVIATWVNKNVTPKETCKWSLEHGYKALNKGTYYSYFEPQGKVYGIEISQLNGSNLRGLSPVKAKPYHDKAVAALNDGNVVIACMSEGLWTSSGHFILLYGLEGSKVLINDPNSTATARTKAELALMQSQVKYYFVCKKPINVKNHSENYYAVQKKYGFGDEFMAHCEAYQWADSLFALMLQDQNNRKFQVNSINYILDYKYGIDAFRKLNQ